MNRRVELDTGQTDEENPEWYAFDKETDTITYGATEDIAVSTWWALYGSLDEKHPRKDWVDYVAHE